MYIIRITVKHGTVHKDTSLLYNYVNIAYGASSIIIIHCELLKHCNQTLAAAYALYCELPHIS